MKYKAGSIIGNFKDLAYILNSSEEQDADENENPDVSKEWRDWELVAAQTTINRADLRVDTSFIMKRKE